MSPERGVIVIPKRIEQGDALGVDRQYLRYCLLYWDHINIPVFIPRGLEVGNALEDVQQLSDEGLLTFTPGYYVKTGRNLAILGYGPEAPPEAWVISQLYAQRRLGGHWVLGQDFEELVLPKSGTLFAGFSETPYLGDFDAQGKQTMNLKDFFDGDGPPNCGADSLTVDLAQEMDTATVSGACAELQILGCLPVPAPSVPMHEILEFKTQRRDELAALRFNLDQLVLEVIGSPDRSRSLDVAMGKVARTIRAIDAVTHERFRDRLLSGFSTRIAIDATSAALFLSTTIAELVLDIPNVATILGTTGAFIRMTFNPSALKPRIPSDLKDFAYLYHAGKDLG